MRSSVVAPDHRPVERHVRQITVEVERVLDPIAGRLIDEQGASVVFSGWLGLASGLERFFAADPAATITTDPAGDPTPHQTQRRAS